MFRFLARGAALCCALEGLLVGLVAPAQAHDPDTTGGLYRSLDAGANWSPINPGIFPSGALALAANPRDPGQLLLATDSGLWRSGNAGRDWQLDAQESLRGPAFGVVFDLEGGRALVATGSGLLRHDGDGWRAQRVPSAATPARALVSGGVAGRVILVGRAGLYRSDDFGRTWSDIGEPLGSNEVGAVIVSSNPPDAWYATVAGALWASGDAGRHWKRLGAGAPRVDAVALDGADPARLWIASGARIHRSDDRGATWSVVGQPLPEPAAKARAIAVAGRSLIVATDRGLFRSADAGATWDSPKENLPAHLAAGVLVRDAANASGLYAGFALAGYDDLRARLPPPALLFDVLERPAWLAASIAIALAILGAIVFAVRSRGRRATTHHRAPRAVVEPR